MVIGGMGKLCGSLFKVRYCILIYFLFNSINFFMLCCSKNDVFLYY